MNAHKYERDMQKLQDQLDAKDKELEGYKGFRLITSQIVTAPKLDG